MLTLYQFPISHYCVKIRWALDYKKINYEERNLLPGLHVLTTKKMAPLTSVPIIRHDDKVIQGSASIITYLDEQFPQLSLTPESAQLKQQALEWEHYLDSEIGIHVRRCCYLILLEHPDVVIPFFTQNGPWYGKLLLTCLFPQLKMRMCRLMNINKAAALNSRQHLAVAIDRVYEQLQDQAFLVGDQFTRADLTAASLLAPLLMPKKYGLNWPAHPPERLEELASDFYDKTEWVLECYEKYR